MTDPMQRAAAVASMAMLRDEVLVHRAFRDALLELLKPGTVLGGAVYVSLAGDEPDYTPPLLAVPVDEIARLLEQHQYPPVDLDAIPAGNGATHGATADGPSTAVADGIEQVLIGRIGAVLRSHRDQTATVAEIRTRLSVRHAIAPTDLTISACLGVLAARGHVEQTEPHGPYRWIGDDKPPASGYTWPDPDARPTY